MWTRLRGTSGGYNYSINQSGREGLTMFALSVRLDIMTDGLGRLEVEERGGVVFLCDLRCMAEDSKN